MNEFREQEGKFYCVFLGTYFILLTTISVDLINYLRDIYLPIRYEFAYFSIKNYYNFGVRVTSWTKGAYSVLKRFLKSHNSTLFDLLIAIEEVLARFKERYHAKLQEEITKRVIKYNYSIIGLL